MPAEPKCPSCNVVGVKHIVSEGSAEETNGGDPWFNIAFCDQCGHVYGVFARYVINMEKKIPLAMPKMPGFP